MNKIGPEFKTVNGKTDIDGLIEFIKTSNSPAEINAALLEASDHKPFYPADKKLTEFFIQSRFIPALDDKLFAAAALSAAARETALHAERHSDREGAFTNFIYLDTTNPGMSKVYKVIRAPHVGSGNGAWGGLRDDDDVNVGSTVNREIFEEVSDALKLLIKIHGKENADALEKEFEACLAEARANKKPLSDGVARFTESLLTRGNMEVYEPAIKLSTDAEYLITDLVKASKEKLFKCRDDAHAIERGWGFFVDAYAHYSTIPRHTAEAFDALQSTIQDLKRAARLMNIPGVGGEMQGIAAYTLKEAPQEVKKNFYGHEGLAEIIGFALLIKQYPRFTIDTLWQDFVDSGAIDNLAKKMRLEPETLKRTYDTLTAQRITGNKPHLEIPAKDYNDAFEQRRHKSAAPQSPIKP